MALSNLFQFLWSSFRNFMFLSSAKIDVSWSIIKNIYVLEMYWWKRAGPRKWSGTRRTGNRLEKKSARQKSMQDNMNTPCCLYQSFFSCLCALFFLFWMFKYWTLKTIETQNKPYTYRTISTIGILDFTTQPILKDLQPRGPFFIFWQTVES